MNKDGDKQLEDFSSLKTAAKIAESKLTGLKKACNINKTEIITRELVMLLHDEFNKLKPQQDESEWGSIDYAIEAVRFLGQFKYINPQCVCPNCKGTSNFHDMDCNFYTNKKIASDKSQNSILTEAELDAEVERILAMSDKEVMADAVREYGSPANAQKAINRMCDGINSNLEKHSIKPIKFQAATKLKHFPKSKVQESGK